MQEQMKKFIEDYSPDGGFLQSDEWQKFQKAYGRNVFSVSDEGFHANIIEHTLPLVGKYFYVPRGPITDQKVNIKNQIDSLVNLARDNNAGWIRTEPTSQESLEAMKSNTRYKITKAPHDMQPRELLIIDIGKSEEEILAEMKPKARYNIKLAEKKGVQIYIKDAKKEKKYLEAFLKLITATAKRNKITPHPRGYYRKMVETIPGDVLKLYVAQYQKKIIAANLVIFWGNTCTYLHGASDNGYRNVMAPYFLQWRQIKDAKLAGYSRYDFGGIRTAEEENNNWQGITRFKTGFSPTTEPTEFPGSYDIVINPLKYYSYKFIQKLKSLIK